MMEVYSERHFFPCTENMVPRGLEPRTFRLLAERSNQLSYETTWKTDAVAHCMQCGKGRGLVEGYTK